MLRTGGAKKWIFEEYLNLSEMQFRFKDKETALLLASSVVHSMQLYPMEEVLTAPYLISDWRPDLIQNLMDDLVPEKCRIVVVGQKVEPICTEVEYWYGTKYRSESIAENAIEVNIIKFCYIFSALKENCNFIHLNVFAGMEKLRTQ